MYVALYRELRKRGPEEAQATEAAVGTGAEEQPKEPGDLEPAAEATESEALEAA
jgi:hypothetical protein